jgi:hypothetical protein
MTYLSPLVPDFQSRRLEFIPRIVRLGLVVDKITLAQVFLPILQSSLVSYVSINNNPVTENVPIKCNNSAAVY